jgi:hypothetical protein
MRNCGGQIASELAILLPLFFFLIFILAELCFLFNAKQLLFLGSFRAARSFLVKKAPSASEAALNDAVSPAEFRDSPQDVTYLKISEGNGVVTAEAVLLYRPLFPVLPLAKLMNIAFFPDRHSGLAERAIAEKAAQGWREKARSRVPLAARVEFAE